MLELGSSGSARGVSSNGHPYRDPRASSPIRRGVSHRLLSAVSSHFLDLDRTSRFDR